MRFLVRRFSGVAGSFRIDRVFSRSLAGGGQGIRARVLRVVCWWLLKRHCRVGARGHQVCILPSSFFGSVFGYDMMASSSLQNAANTRTLSYRRH